MDDDDTAYMIDPTRVALVDKIIRAGNAEVVISSTWRRLYKIGRLNRWLRERGLSKDVLGKTPTSNECRGSEIDSWLSLEGKQRFGVSSFVILDDESDMNPHMDRLVQTDSRVGITEQDVSRALGVLERPWSPVVSR